MVIRKERTRLLITEFTEEEYKKIENLVAAMDNVFMYYDKYKKLIGMETGMENSLKKIFKNARFIDNSTEYWPYARIEPVEHSAKPRNQLQIDFINFVLENAKKKQKLAGILSPGTGKLHPNFTKLPAPNKQGYILMGDLKVGDKIFGSDGSPVTVTNIYEHPNADIYKVSFNDGRYSLCGKDHLWAVSKAWTSKIYVMTTEEIMNGNYKYYDSYKSKLLGEDRWKYNYRIPLLSSPVEYEHQDVPIHPYIVGAMIGNGCCTLGKLSLSSGDDFVPRKVACILGVKTVKRTDCYTYNFFNIVDGVKHYLHTKDFFKELPEMISTYSRDKIIPDIYMYNDVEIRMELLRGLMDTDGSIRYADGRFNVSYSSCSRRLLEQIQELIRGLGFIANIKTPDKREEKYVGGYHAEISIRVPNGFKQYLFSKPSKHKVALEASYRGDYQQPFTHLVIHNIEKVGRADSRCITVDADDHLYLTQDFIVTHNTFMACYSAIALGIRTLFIAPTSGIKDQWADTLTGMFKVPKERVLNIKSPKQFVKVNADFVVISQASLASLNKNYDLEAILRDNKFGIKVIDEVQMWFKNIVQVDANCNIANNWYLTGTFGRSGATENKIYQEMFGDLAIFREKDKKPTLFNPKPGNVYGMKPHMHVKMMWTNAELTKAQLKKVTASMRYSEREGKWMRFGISVPAYSECVFPSDGRMTKYLKTCLKVIRMAEREVTYGRTLVLTSTISATFTFQKYLQEIFPDKKIGTYHSKNTKDKNVKNKAECDILVSTISSAGTGFDMKDLSKLITCTMWSSWILSDQISGRLRRRPDGKDTYMWDITDAQLPQARAWARNRADVYRRKAKTFKVIDM